MKKYIKVAYDKCIYIFNNGVEYEFYTNFSKRPTKIMMALDEQYLEFAIKNKRKYMNEVEFKELRSWIERDDKPWGYAEMADKVEQAKIVKAHEEKNTCRFCEIYRANTQYKLEGIWKINYCPECGNKLI